MFKLDLVTWHLGYGKITDAHIDYLRHTQEQANTLWEIVEQAKVKQPLDRELDFACKYATRIQEFFFYVQDAQFENRCLVGDYCDAIPTSVEPMNFKQAMTETVMDRCAIQDENYGILKDLKFGNSVPCPDKDNPSHVYKLKKALYGLKQAPRTWYDMMSSFLISQTISKGTVDPNTLQHARNELLLVIGLILPKSTNKAVKWIFRYLNGTINMGLIMSSITAQQTKLDLELVLHRRHRLIFGNVMEESLAALTLRNPHFSRLDVIGITPCF
ncbi:copia protein [Tanacetum coccineum]